MNPTYSIGDYVSYTSESYNGGRSYGGYDYTTEYGCITEIDNECYVSVVKQYGGQIWVGVTPSSKITEDDFLSKFSLYDEFKNEILKKIHLLPEKLRNKIHKIIYTKIQSTIKNVFSFSLKNILRKDNKFSPETWYIYWYIMRILRSYEPFRIHQTLTYCHGASKNIQRIMKDNIDFMIQMQFSSANSQDMLLLIEEKVLDFKSKSGAIISVD